MAKKKHDVRTLPKWAQALIADLREKVSANRIRQRARAKVWVDRYGNETRIVDLSTEHLRNIYIGGFGSEAQRRNIDAELARRGSL